MDPQALETRDFHHPYTPYDIQVDFMNAVYDCIEDGKIGIFESPTGTGKSLSLICGSLTWLRSHEKRQIEENFENNIGDDDEPAWMLEHAKQEKIRDLLQQRTSTEVRLAKIRAREKRQKDIYENDVPSYKKQKAVNTQNVSDDSDEARFVLDEYISDEEEITQKSSLQGTLSSETQELMQRLGMDVGQPKKEEDVQPEDALKIFYCSRTHSQLTQFINELRRVRIPPSLQTKGQDGLLMSDSGDSVIHAEMKHLTLGSRKNLCINPKVSKLGSATAINERCLELQQPGVSAESKCRYLPKKDNEVLVNEFRDHTLARIRDIEDLGALGKRIEICPYYASRPTIKPSEIVTLPYPLLLQRSARESLDLSLKGHVVIIDEAHNLMDAVSNIYSTDISASQLKRAREQLRIYLQKFRNKLKGKNRVYVTQLVRLLDSLSGYLSSITLDGTSMEGLVNPAELLTGKGVDQINLYKLMRYLVESKLARKVDGYHIHNSQQSEAGGKVLESTPHNKTTEKKPNVNMPVLTHLQSFLLALTNPSEEGKFFYMRNDEDDTCLKYLLLDPTHHFKEIVDEARAVILAGGTMSPMTDYTNHLFAYAEKDRVRTLSCGHVIPPENLVAYCLSSGASGRDLEFTFEKRSSPALLNDLGETVIRLCSVIPDGVVIFFPSYGYLAQVTQHWEKVPPGSNKRSTLQQLVQIKGVFRESKENASVEGVLQDYSQSIDKGNGGLLLSVIGGKMSEGINFSDRLGRGVIVVGLPFPNAHSAQWKAKLEFVERMAYERAVQLGSSETTEFERRRDAKAAGRELYENACMRAVNQSIGRAIRHRGDYASIILLDKRYQAERINKKLPGWIRKGMMANDGNQQVSDVTINLRKFFTLKDSNIK